MSSTDPQYAALAARLQELEDVREITEVFYDFHHACTGGFNGLQAGRMEALDCLTDDATIEVAQLHEPGKGPRGREAVQEYWHYFYGDDGPLPYVFQTSVADKVVVTGDTAVQYSNMLGMFWHRDDQPVISLSKRVNDFVRTEKGWRISKTTIEGGFSAPLEEFRGRLNPLPPQEPRTPWTYQG